MPPLPATGNPKLPLRLIDGPGVFETFIAWLVIIS